MSGFIGYYELFLKLELALDIKLEQSEKNHIKQKLRPLSEKNVFNLEDKYLNEAINSIEVRETEDRKKYTRFFVFLFKS